MSFNDTYINIEVMNKLNNYKLLIHATEYFTQLMYFLEQERGYKNIETKIGDFSYDGWNADIYCILNENGVSFKHIRDFDNGEWSKETLTEQLIYAWDFEITQYNIYFEIINEYWKILNDKDKKIYDELYEEVHCKFW